MRIVQLVASHYSGWDTLLLSLTKILPEKLFFSSSSKEFPHIFMERKLSIPFFSQKPATYPHSEQDQFSPHTQTIPLRCILILSSRLHLGLPSDLFHSDFSTEPCMYLSSSPYLPHEPPISLFLIWSPEWYLVRSAGRETRQCTISSSLLLTPPLSPTYPF